MGNKLETNGVRLVIMTLDDSLEGPLLFFDQVQTERRRRHV